MIDTNVLIHALVSGDADLLQAPAWPGLRILSVAQALLHMEIHRSTR